VWGAEFLEGRSGFDLAARVARWHHERWDGTGYPDGLRGEQIPQEVAIVTVADAFDAMVQDRPYRKGRSLEAAMHEIVACQGRQFSPVVVSALSRIYSRGDLDAFGRKSDEEDLAA
jgi:HD-GYP domain-containing protein (c-di-GMP phosphodiesterase class II)